MARIVLGAASPHGPQLRIPVERWSVLRAKDEMDRRMDYQALLRKAPPGLEDEITEERMKARHARCHQALDRLKRNVLEAKPDLLVVMGDDQHEQFHADNMPMFCVFRGDSMPLVEQQAPASGWRSWHHEEVGAAPVRDRYSAAPDFADRLIGSLCESGCDVACADELDPEVGMGHAFSFVYEYLVDGEDIPMVPIMVNALYPPNQPTARRCLEFGEAVRRAVEAEASDRRVVVIATGGLSHVIMDEALDRMVLDAVVGGDRERLATIPGERLTRGTGEMRAWLMAIGALGGLTPEVLAYEPGYRSPAGTGCGMGFACWR